MFHLFLRHSLSDTYPLSFIFLCTVSHLLWVLLARFTFNSSQIVKNATVWLSGHADCLISDEFSTSAVTDAPPKIFSYRLYTEWQSCNDASKLFRLILSFQVLYGHFLFRLILVWFGCIRKDWEGKNKVYRILLTGQ